MKHLLKLFSILLVVNIAEGSTNLPFSTQQTSKTPPPGQQENVMFPPAGHRSPPPDFRAFLLQKNSPPPGFGHSTTPYPRFSAPGSPPPSASKSRTPGSLHTVLPEERSTESSENTSLLPEILPYLNALLDIPLNFSGLSDEDLSELLEKLTFMSLTVRAELDRRSYISPKEEQKLPFSG